MSIDIWPPVSPEERKIKEAEALENELAWITQRTLKICQDLKHGLEDCYALLAPIDPGSTLVMSTPRNERVKGTITRVGTRIVKGSLTLQFRTLPPQTLTLSQSYPIHIRPLEELHTRLTESIDLLTILLSEPSEKAPRPDAQAISSALRVLADSITASVALLKGPSLAEQLTNWTSESCPPAHFTPPLSPQFSFHMMLQECCVVIYMRALEPVAAPVHFGTKLGLAIGTFRRLEHDEMDMVFKYNPAGDDSSDVKRSAANHSIDPNPGRQQVEDVYVREKVRVESADPSLISLYSKLGFLSIMLHQARQNLEAVMEVDLG